MSESHGYVPYTRGCRCEVCRAAKSDYMRERRKVAKMPARDVQVRADGTVLMIAKDIRHGTRHGYEEYGCRCTPCRIAHNTSDRRWLR